MAEQWDFYPRPHMEGDVDESEWPGEDVSYFYPRPHMEGDQGEQGIAGVAADFYPRPHMEGDLCACRNKIWYLFISTHALTWRATVTTVLVPWIKSNFYPRPHMEGDFANQSRASVGLYFYPRPHMEGDGWGVDTV